MAKGITGVEDIIMYSPHPTGDGRWMIAACINGLTVQQPGFLGSREDADVIAKILSEREIARYKADSAAVVSAAFSSSSTSPSFKEIAEQHGIIWLEE